MYPELFRIGSFPVNTYGVFLALAFLGAIMITVRLAARDGLPRERIYDLCLWMLLASLIGSKALMFFTERDYRDHPSQLFSLDFLRSGGVFYGGLIGAVLTGYFLMRRYKLPWWKTADACAPGIALGNVLGRQGCFSAGCCWGKPTTLPWGVKFTALGHEITGVPIGIKLHPTQLYESFSMLIVFFFLLWLHRHRRFSGQVILAYAFIYAVVRFIIEFFRDDPRGDVFGLTTLTGLSTSQLIGIVVGLGALVLLIVRWCEAPQRTQRDTEEKPRHKTVKSFISLAVIAILFLAVAPVQHHARVQSPTTDSLWVAGEKHLRNIKQLTFDGQNAEAYFNIDGTKLIFQSNHGGLPCDQIFTMNIDGSDLRMVSSGMGKTTCSYYFPNGKRILYSSTHLGNKECPPRPDYSKGYVWQVHDTYDVFTAKPNGSDLKRLTATPGYDAESTISRDGKKIVFTSMRDGDLDIYTMDANGKHVKRLTTELGYDGGPFWSYDGKQIVYRAFHPQTPAEIARYKQKLAEGVIEPTVFEIWVMNADGSNKRQVTHLGVASFAPYFFPNGKRIIFASNLKDPHGRNFDLFAINVDGSGLEQITFNDTFDGFPMFSPNGGKLVFASNRNAKTRGETNVFIADWVE